MATAFQLDYNNAMTTHVENNYAKLYKCDDVNNVLYYKLSHTHLLTQGPEHRLKQSVCVCVSL